MTANEQQALGKTLWSIAEASSKHNAFLKELGLPPLP